MKRNLLAGAVVGLACALIAAPLLERPARAQSSPGWYNGQVLTAGQLNAALASKLDVGASSLLAGSNSWTGAQAFQGPVAFASSISATSPVSTSGATYTVSGSDNYLICTNATGCTYTLPSPSAGYRVLHVKTTGGGAVTSASANVIPLAGGAAGTAIVGSTAGKWAELVSNGTNYSTMAGN